jgi:hypothetical protein
MRDVEGRNVSPFITPQHRAIARIGNRESPNCRVEIGDTHSRHSIFSISVGERVAEDRIQ